MKKLIALIVVLSLALVGVAQGAKSSANRTREVERLCVWVEPTGTPDTRFDLKAVKAYTATQKICIVGKRGKNGKAGAKGAVGAQGAVGSQGAVGAQGAKGDQGATGATGATGPAGPKGDDGAQGPAGPQGHAGPQGPKGDAGFSGLITVAGGTASGDKQFTVNCPLNESTPDPNDRLEAISGGFNIQGSVTADYRSDSAGNPMGSTSWTVKQSSGANLSGAVYVYCMAPAAP